VILALFCLVYFALAALAIPLGYHRMLTHRAFVLPRPLAYFVVLVGLPAGTPIQWVGNHRAHHLHTDREGDPHSPHLRGFWFAHTGWYLETQNVYWCSLYALGGPARMLFDAWHRPRSNQQSAHLAKDIARDRFYRCVSNKSVYGILVAAHALGLVYAASLLDGTLGVLTVWGVSVLLYNLGDCIDSVGHLWGQRPFVGEHRARNNSVLGLLTLGEGWHANHHAFPSSARHGLLPGQPDPIFQLVRLLRVCGIATHVQDVSNSQLIDRLKA
jgi:fatty-acid desaturase